jgi:hypothetical protein
LSNFIGHKAKLRPLGVTFKRRGAGAVDLPSDAAAGGSRTEAGLLNWRRSFARHEKGSLADMIRDDARAEAERWIASLNVLPCTYGTLIDLREPAAAVPYCGYYRMLILRAAERQLTKQGARVVLPD